MMIATAPADLTASIETTVTVTDVDTEAPGKPGTPTMAPKPGNGHQASAEKWIVPEDSGPAIMGYIVLFRVDDSETEWGQVIIDRIGVETTISGSSVNTSYEAEVHGANDAGDWSRPESGHRCDSVRT